MPRFLLKLIIGAGALWVATKVVPGVSISNYETLAIAALLLGLVNAIVRPVIILLTLPLTLITLGLFLLVVNGISISLVDWLLEGMKVDTFGHAMLAALVVWIVSWAGEMILGVKTRQSEEGA